MNLKEHKYLITGATGFIGSALVAELLLNHGVLSENIYLLVRKRPDPKDSLLAKRLRLVGLDADLVLKNIHIVETSFESERIFQNTLKGLVSALGGFPWLCVHLAAIIKAKGEGAIDQQRRLNLGVTQDLLNFCNKHGASNFIYLSSMVAFGVSLSAAPRSEKDFERFPFLSRAMPYYSSKRQAHEWLRMQHVRVPRVILCPSIVHGALENEKDSRAHLRALESGRLRWAPAGEVNIVSLRRVVEECVVEIQREPTAPIRERLLVEKNTSLQSYFQHYANRFGKKQKIHRFPALIGPVLWLFTALVALLRRHITPTLEGAVGGSSFLNFESEFPFKSRAKSLEEIVEGIT